MYLAHVLEHAQVGFPQHIVELLDYVYKNQEAAAKTNCGTLEWFSIRRGVKQGCVVSPSRFSIYSEGSYREHQGSNPHTWQNDR